MAKKEKSQEQEQEQQPQAPDIFDPNVAEVQEPVVKQAEQKALEPDDEGGKESQSKEVPGQAGAASEPQKPQHLPGLVRMALEFGVEQADIDASTPEQLDRLVFHLAKHIQKQPSPDGSSQPAKAEPKELEVSFEDTGLGGEEKDWEPGIVALAKRMVAAEKKYEQVVGELSKAKQESQLDQETRVIDQAFSTLDGNVFGTGGIAEVADPAARARREAVVRHAVHLAGEGATVTLIAQKINEAAKQLFPGQQAQQPAAGYNLEERKEQWRQGAVAQPSHRDIPEVTGRAKAIRTVSEFLKERGVSEPSSTTLDQFI